MANRRGLRPGRPNPRIHIASRRFGLRSAATAAVPNGDAPPQRSNAAELARSLLLAEYNAIRAKSADARNTQQPILQWSLAAAGVVVAGVVSGSARGGAVFAQAVAFVLTTIVPIVLLCALAVWLSEVSRMLRAAKYIRMREEAFRSAAEWPTDIIHWFATEPIIWESLLVERKEWRGRADLGPIAVAVLYGAMVTVSNLVGQWVLWSSAKVPGAVFAVSIVGTGVGITALAALAIYAYHVVKDRTT